MINCPFLWQNRPPNTEEGAAGAPHFHILDAALKTPVYISHIQIQKSDSH